MNHHFHFVLSLLLLLPYLGDAQKCDKTLQIDPNRPPSPVEKKGYHLIFQEEFNGDRLDTLRWDRSTWGNEYTECFNGYFQNNPNNVEVSNGTLKLKITADSFRNCSVSGAEIKTFNTLGRFQDYKFMPNTFLETRAKMAYGANVGCAGWLYMQNPPDLYREIDLWEVTPWKTDRFQCNRHLGRGTKQDLEWICLEDLGGKPLDLSNYFVTFGLDWTPEVLHFYVNGQLSRELVLKDKTHIFNTPMDFRLNAGVASLNGEKVILDSLPKQMEVDYVRVYVKDGLPANHFVQNPQQCNQNEGFGFCMQHYPDAKFTLEVPEGFTYQDTHDRVNQYFWLTTNDKVMPDKTHLLRIHIDFGTGYSEDWLYPIYVKKNIAPTKTYKPIWVQGLNRTLGKLVKK